MSTCKCGRRKREDLPACRKCWDHYLDGSAPDVYVPETDGLVTPYESSLEWERAMIAIAGRNPFKCD